MAQPLGVGSVNGSKSGGCQPGGFCTFPFSSLIALRLSRDRARQKALTEVAVSASLSAWYGSPPGAAHQAQAEDRVPKPLLWWAHTL